MIAKRTIIREENILRGMSRDDRARGVGDMAVALQWHVVSNGTEPVALATSRSAETGVGEKDVLIVVCDSKQGRMHDIHSASLLARSIFDAYNEREARSSANGSDTFIERIDIARWLADAISSGLRQLCQPESARTTSGVSVAPSTGSSTPVDPFMSVIAAVIHRDKLLVARYGSGRVYLLRNGALQNLTDESFTDATHAEQLEPDLGQLDLIGEDRVLLCTEPLHRQLQDAQIRSVLRSTPAARRAAQTLLDAATKAPTDDNIALAVADYVSGRTDTYALVPVKRPYVQPVTGPRRGTFRSLLSLGALLVLIAALGTGIVAFSRGMRGLLGANSQNTTIGAPPDPRVTSAMISATETSETREIATAVAATQTAEPTETPALTSPPIATESVAAQPVTATTEPITVEQPLPLSPTPAPPLAVEPTTVAPEATAAPLALGSTITYTVRVGDTPLEIARANNIPLDELLRNNPGLNPTGLQVGQVLVIRLIPVASAPELAPTVTPTSVVAALQPTPTRRPTRRPRPSATPRPAPPTAIQAPPTPAPTETPKPWSQPPGDQPPPPQPTPFPCPPGATCP